MAISFSDSLNAVSNTAVTSEQNEVENSSTSADIENETWIRSEKYTWYEEYEDDKDLSVVDDRKNVIVNKDQINLTQEKNSQIIGFIMPRRSDGIDIANAATINFHIVNSVGNEYMLPAVNVSYSDTKIRFHFMVSEYATMESGPLAFEIVATGSTSAGEYVWRTRPNNEFYIMESLSGTGTIEPADGWDSYIELITQKVTEAQSAANKAQQAADSAKGTVDSAKEEIKAALNEAIADSLNNYYTKEEVDTLLKDIDLSAVYEAINNIDGLAKFNTAYDSSTRILTFYNGENIIKTETLNSDPSVEWTTAYDAKMDTKITEATKQIKENVQAINTDLESLHNTVDDLPQSLKTDYYNKEDVDSLLGNKANTSKVSDLENKVAAVESTANTNKANIASLGNKVSELEEHQGSTDTSQQFTYDVDYDDENKFTFYEIEKEGTDSEVRTPKKQFVIKGGGGGGSSTSSTLKIEYITKSPLVVTKNDKALVKFIFSGIDSSGDEVSDAEATWKIGNTIIANTTVVSGENTFDATDYVNLGTQKLLLSVKDAAGSLVTKQWTIQKIDVRIESTFNENLTYPIGTISFDYTPHGAVSKEVHFILDGQELPSVTTVSSGIPMAYTLPSQEHGSHLLETYMTADVNGTQIESNHIIKDIIWYDSESTVPVIGCSTQNITVLQYDAYNIVYSVYDSTTETPKVILAVDGEEISTLTLNETKNTWQFKSSEVGPHILTITCGETVKTINVVVEKLDINVDPVTANLAFDFNPIGYSNNDENRLWTNEDKSIAMTVSDNFDWVNGGYQLDENGDQFFKIKAGTTATFSYNMFADDARKNGKEFKLIFKTENVRKSNATFLTCQTSDPKIGLQMNVHEAYVRSSVDALYIPYSEEDIIEFEFNIFKDTEIPLVLSYEDGTPGRPMIYNSDHSFTQINPVPIIIGSEDCDVLVYRMKAYSSSLTDSGVLSNFIADARNATEMIARYNRNQIYDENNQLTPESLAKACPDLKVIKIECPHFTNDKKDFVKNTSVECIHVGGDPVLDNWKAINAYHSGQGTTSNEYGQAGRNIDLLMCFDGNYKNSKITYDENYKTVITMGDGTKYENGTGKITLTRNSVPTNYLNLKVNIASSENENNALLQKNYNTFLPYLNAAQKKNPNVKNTMEFVNCVVFLKESDPDLSTHREFQNTEWNYYALGNLGDSKKTDASRVVNANDPNEFVVEIMDNTLPNSTFSGTEEALAALEADTFNEKGTYGFRYEMAGITDEQQQANIAKWKEFYRFVATTTDEEFVAGLKNWFIVDSALYFYLFTERYTMIDNRAKNVFFHYMKHFITSEEASALGDDAKYFVLDDEAALINNGYRFEFWNYDNDSSLGINNSGELTMTYGKEDTDYRTDGDPSSGYIFNAAESKFFCRIRDLMHNELAAMFLQCESKGAWSADRLINQFDTAQSQFPEEIWRLDYIRKYRRTYEEGTPRFLVSMMNGKKKYQRRQFERDQEKYMATKYFGTTATSDQIMFRCNTPVDAVVTPDYTLF